MDNFKETAFSRHSMEDAHMNSQTLVYNSHKVHKLKPDKMIANRSSVYYP